MPRCAPPLDANFRPAALVHRSFCARLVGVGGGVPVVLGLERGGESISRFETAVFAAGTSEAVANFTYIERLVKFLLWQRGGHTLYVGGPALIAEQLREVYSGGGARAFDYAFLGEKIYRQPFRLVHCSAGEVPDACERPQALGRQLSGCRIGFDLGASDYKVAAVVDGETIFSEETPWAPVVQEDPEYHYAAIKLAIERAAAQLPRVDAIGGSSAGIYVDSEPRVASLFRGIPEERFDAVRGLFRRIGDELGIPITVVNDGEVTALAGSMSLGDNSVLGIALGSSEAGGYVTEDGGITDWLNELAFCPIDYHPAASVEEWSGDRGVGARYLSQQCVFRLAPVAGIELDEGAPAVERLREVQSLLEAGHGGAVSIWQTLGVYLGYAVAHYATFYDVRHVLILGRCTSGLGGDLLLAGAREVLKVEFPEIAARVAIQLPDEKSRRVGQSITAASLPILDV